MGSPSVHHGRGVLDEVVSGVWVGSSSVTWAFGGPLAAAPPGTRSWQAGPDVALEPVERAERPGQRDALHPVVDDDELDPEVGEPLERPHHPIGAATQLAAHHLARTVR